MAKDSKLKNAGVSGYNKPKRTPNHKTKSHVVVAKKGEKTKTIRFGQQGVSGAGKFLNQKKIKHVRKVIMQDTMHKILALINLVLDIGVIKLNGN